MELTKLTTTQNSLSTKADYEICAQLKNKIQADSSIIIEFPS